MALLSPGDQFPALTVALAGGGTLQLPDAIGRLVPDDVTGMVRYIREHAMVGA
jgi:hypothetical protein